MDSSWANLSMLNALLLTVSLVSVRNADRPDIVLADFEGKTYAPWTVTGTAFGEGPAHGTLPNQMAVSGFKGHGLANSYHGGDDSTGTLASPSFKVQRKYIDFLIGGGKFEGKTCINLLVDGRVVRTQTGPNDQPGGSEALAWKGWDVSEFQDKVASIQVVDLASGGWGHICVDQIIESDRKREAIRVQRSIKIDQKYLLLPVKNGAPKARIKCEVDGVWLTEFAIELAPEKPDFWVFLDTERFQGKTLTLSTESDGDSNPLATLKQSKEIDHAGSLYKEALRPQFHFSSRVGWLNDPNGLVFNDGEYHLFYQHNPYGWAWDNMHWGHAVSSDLMHWKELPIAIYPHKWDDWVFSGSAVIDHQNTSGFKTGTKDVMVAAYTSTGRGECIAYSQDGGRTFTDYSENPVVKHSGRDPKVFWYEPGKHWVMALYDELDGKQWIEYLSSPDLKHWTSESRIEGFFECPELFELPVAGHPGESQWATYAASGEYRLGSFDGKTFTPSTEKIPLQHGNIFYASQTYNDAPGARRIQVGWGRADSPGMPFNQCMLFPSELTLHHTAAGSRIFVNPAKEIHGLYQKEHSWSSVDIKSSPISLEAGKGGLLDIQLDLSLEAGSKLALSLFGSPLTYDASKAEVEFRGCHGPVNLRDGKLRLRILTDRTTVEIYANDGELYMPVGGTNLSNLAVSLSALSGQVRLDSAVIHELKPSMIPSGR